MLHPARRDHGWDFGVGVRRLRLVACSLGPLQGVKPVVIAIILEALWKLGRTAVKSVWLAIVGLVTLFLAVVGGSPLLVLIVGGFVGIVVLLGPTRVRTALITFLEATSSMPGAARALPRSPGLLPTFLIFVKIGSIVFGSGYVLLVFLHADLVERHGWLTQQQLLDAVAVGQVTPGPVFTTATFLGYLLHGTPGAIVATIGIFLPAFVLVALSAPLIPKMRASRLRRRCARWHQRCVSRAGGPCHLATGALMLFRFRRLNPPGSSLPPAWSELFATQFRDGIFSIHDPRTTIH